MRPPPAGRKPYTEAACTHTRITSYNVCYTKLLRELLAAAAPRDVELATEIALCQNLIKGYGDTHARGWRNFERIMQVVERHEPAANLAARVRELREAALADEKGERLEASYNFV